MEKNILADHARWPNLEDSIFKVGGEAKKAIEEKGREKIINSTIGALIDDDGKLIAFDSVYDTLKNMDKRSIASYGAIEGDKDFLEGVISKCFGNYRPEGFIRSISTVGGTGAVRHVFWSLLGEGDYVICPNWYWPAYMTMCEEFNRKFKTYEFLDKDFNFNIEAFKLALDYALDKRDRVVCVFNSPANNPTGFTIDDSMWDKIIDIIKDRAKEGKYITILLDVAYIEFAGDGSQKKFFEKFSYLPENILTTVAYSMSKSYTAYGLRAGACIIISKKKEIADSVFNSMKHSNRATWSNITHVAMTLLTEIEKDKEKSKSYKDELEKYRIKLQKRADAFMEASKEVGLITLPYFGGFFISIPCDRTEEIAEKLKENDIYIVANKQGLRFAVCAVSEDKCRISPKLIKDTIDFINK
ncbi:aminotransferase class I/II-fold pyridoxal phosphate-dependent enzyme [Anaerococcus sp. AGMB00486]|uniref:Aminotransferase class I/II-fold pyridoxal phosphate-dependent enzyme n=1 Tax=Anaerococcus faecalis TaxID=2742993 RepID=A0ABX2NB89_9FIRM|nr:aminotransferase class I/II-fold pyridoxal phosphate-dependent enzyme [Anaerococcus faecalis]NVF11905.1 aminotransferase class I/II-fold pyridoxal phosphate-dependent enzyme [Anaerococcus faecalis]